MTQDSIPQKAVNVSGNFRGFSPEPKRPLTEEERIQAEVERYNVKSFALQNDDDLNIGETDLVAFARLNCKTYHFCRRDKFITNFVATRKGKRHINPTTAKRYLNHVIRCGFVMEMTDLRGNDILLAADKPARMAQWFDALQAEKTECEASKRRVSQAAEDRQRAEKLEFLNLGRRAAASTPPAPDQPADQPTDQPAPEEATQNPADGGESFADQAQNFADQAESFAEEPVKFSQDGVKTLHGVQMGIGGGISPSISVESVQETTTDSSPADQPVAEESRTRDAEAGRRKREDAVAGEEVVVVRANSAGEEQERTAGEGEEVEAQNGDGNDLMLNDPFDHVAPTKRAETPLEANKKAVLKFAPSTPDEVALSTMIVNIADTFSEQGVQIKHVEAMITTDLEGVGTTKTVKRLEKALKTYQVVEANPTKAMENPWNYFVGIVKNVHTDMTKAEASEPVIHVVAAKVDPLCAPEVKVGFDAYMDGLTPEQAVALYAEAENVTAKDWRRRKEFVANSMKRIVAEKTGHDDTRFPEK